MRNEFEFNNRSLTESVYRVKLVTSRGEHHCCSHATHSSRTKLSFIVSLFENIQRIRLGDLAYPLTPIVALLRLCFSHKKHLHSE